MTRFDAMPGAVEAHGLTTFHRNRGVVGAVDIARAEQHVEAAALDRALGNIEGRREDRRAEDLATTRCALGHLTGCPTEGRARLDKRHRAGVEAREVSDRAFWLDSEEHAGKWGRHRE